MPGIAICNSPILTCGAPIWTPAGISGCILHLGRYAESRATRATQPTPDDWDMERADTTRWTVYTNATLSKETTTPHGGARCLRITPTTEGNSIVYQSLFVAGNMYRIAGYARSDGSRTPQIGDWVKGNKWVGTTSVSWQTIDTLFTAQHANFTLGCGGLATQTGYVEFDDFGFTNLSVASYTPAFTTISGAALGQSSAAYMPWIDQTVGALRFDGTADNMSLSGALSSWKCLHDGTGVTVLVALKRTTSGDYVLSTDNATNTNVGVSLRRASDPGTAELRIHNGSGTPVCTVTQTGLTIDTPHVLEYSLSTADGAEITVDGVSNASGLTGSCSGSNPSYAPMFMARQGGGWLAGYLYDILVIARRLAPTDPERVAARRYMAALCGAVVP